MKQRSRFFSSYYLYGWRRTEGDALCVLFPTHSSYIHSMGNSEPMDQGFTMLLIWITMRFVEMITTSRKKRSPTERLDCSDQIVIHSLMRCCAVTDEAITSPGNKRDIKTTKKQKKHINNDFTKERHQNNKSGMMVENFD